MLQRLVGGHNIASNPPAPLPITGQPPPTQTTKGPKEWSAVALEPPTNLVWEGIRGSDSLPNEDHIRDALHLALSKFWAHGRYKGSIRGEHWKKGTLGQSIYCTTLLREMLNERLIYKVRISGASEGGYAFDRESLADLQTFMDNRHIVGKVKKVFDALTNLLRSIVRVQSACAVCVLGALTPAWWFHVN